MPDALTSGHGKKLNALAGVIVGVLVLLSVVLTASVLFPNITGSQIEAVLAGGISVGAGVALYLVVQAHRNRDRLTVDDALAETDTAKLGGCRHSGVWSVPS